MPLSAIKEGSTGQLQDSSYQHCKIQDNNVVVGGGEKETATRFFNACPTLLYWITKCTEAYNSIRLPQVPAYITIEANQINLGFYQKTIKYQ
jgi:hypothetical protein